VPDDVGTTRDPTPDELELIQLTVDPHTLREQEVPTP